MVIELDARQIELDASLFYISIPFPKPEDLELVFTVRRCAPVSPFSVWTQPPQKLMEVFSISKPTLLLCILDMYYS